MAHKKLKDWFDKELAILLSKKIKQVNNSFDDKSFIKQVTQKITDLELKDRVETIADSLYKHLNEDYLFAIDTLRQILGPENEEETGMFTEYYWLMPIAKLVEKYGLNDFDSSVEILGEITKRNTAEYAIRPFYNQYPKLTLKQMKLWSGEDNAHLRRLASEGLRPRLPWAKKITPLIDNPKPLLPILNKLKDDTSKYVQKSVANCLNDILKDNFEIAQVLINKWVKKPTEQRKWIIKHALRNLIKNKDKWALKVISSF